MSPERLTEDFGYRARPGEIIVPARIGYKGMDMGPAYVISDRFDGKIDTALRETPEGREAELVKFDNALTKFLGIFHRMSLRADKVGVQINDAYENMLEAELLFAEQQVKKIQPLREKISEIGISAEKAIDSYFSPQIQKVLAAIERLKDEDGTLSENGALLQKPLGMLYFGKNTLLNLVRGNDYHSLDGLTGNLPITQSPIPVKTNFQVGDLGFLRDDTGHGTKVHSIIRCDGTSGDHTEIIAKGVRIAVANVESAQMAQIKNGEMLIVDGRKGIIIIDPAPQTLEEYTEEINATEKRNRRLTGASMREKWASTLDNATIKISANIGFVDEMYAVTASNAAAVGLYRTEIDIKARSDLDNANTPLSKFVEIYDALAKASIDNKGKAKSITMRTPDLVEDKKIRNLTPEKKEELTNDCIRAICITQKNNPPACFHIMFPMIETAAQFSEMRERVYNIAREENISAPKTGAMIETLGAIKEMEFMNADFYSIGTNDLIPQIIGYDRYKESNAYDPTDPRVISALEQIMHEAIIQNKQDALSICGDVASQPKYFALLIGMEFSHLSAGPGEVPFHKELVRRINTGDAAKLLERIKDTPDREERIKILEQFNEELLGLHPDGTLEEDFMPPSKRGYVYTHYDQDGQA